MIVCRGCGKAFGEAPKKINIKGAPIIDVCPDCQSKEKKGSKRDIKVELREVLFDGGVLLQYEEAQKQFKQQIDALPVSSKSQVRSKNLSSRHIRFEGDSK